MLAPPPTQEATNHERKVANEMEEMEKIDEEREESSERIRRLLLEWKARRAQETLVRADKGMIKVVDSEKDAEQTGFPSTRMSGRWKYTRYTPLHHCTIAWPSSCTHFTGRAYSLYRGWNSYKQEGPN